MTLLAFISGALFRRWWGGWLSPNGTVKRIVGFLLPLMVGLWVWGLHWLPFAYAACLSLAWLMPSHGYGISMGADANHPERTMLQCILVMGLQYGAISCAVAAFWWFGYHHSAALLYAPLGLTVAISYALARLAFPNGVQFGSMIDSPAAIGELWLGGILLGGVPLCITLTKLV